MSSLSNTVLALYRTILNYNNQAESNFQENEKMLVTRENKKMVVTSIYSLSSIYSFSHNLFWPHKEQLQLMSLTYWQLVLIWTSQKFVMSKMVEKCFSKVAKMLDNMVKEYNLHKLT